MVCYPVHCRRPEPNRIVLAAHCYSVCPDRLLPDALKIRDPACHSWLVHIITYQTVHASFYTQKENKSRTFFAAEVKKFSKFWLSLRWVCQKAKLNVPVLLTTSWPVCAAFKHKNKTVMCGWSGDTGYWYSALWPQPHR